MKWQQPKLEQSVNKHANIHIDNNSAISFHIIQATAGKTIGNHFNDHLNVSIVALVPYSLTQYTERVQFYFGSISFLRFFVPFCFKFYIHSFIQLTQFWMQHNIKNTHTLANIRAHTQFWAQSCTRNNIELKHMLKWQSNMRACVHNAQSLCIASFY